MNFTAKLLFCTRRFAKIISVLGCFFILLGCSNPFELEENKVSFDGYKFSTKLNRDKVDDRSFSLVVKRANRSLSGAREAGRYEGTKFCIKNFGTSDIEWVLNPDDNNVGLTGKVLQLSGRCVI